MERTDPLLKVTILPRGRPMGYSQSQPSDRMLQTRDDLFDRMCALLGGRIAESLVLGSLTTGAHDDLGNVTNIAYQMVARFGMSEKVGSHAVFNHPHDVC